MRAKTSSGQRRGLLEDTGLRKGCRAPRAPPRPGDARGTRQEAQTTQVCPKPKPTLPGVSKMASLGRQQELVSLSTGSQRRLCKLPPASSSWRMLGQMQRRRGLLTRRPSRAQGTNQVCLPEGLGLGYLQDKELGSRARRERRER